MSVAPRTALGGTLERRPDGWRWRDGTPEPRVSDLPVAAVHNYRVSRRGDAAYVEVPVGRAREEDDLAFVRVGAAEGLYRRGPDVDAGLARLARAGSDDHHVHGRDAYYVPVEDWDRHWREHGPLGASWERADEPAILARARELGWTGGGS